MTDGDRKLWREWKEATFGSDFMIWHDGLGTDGVTRLRGDARDEAIGMLLLGLRLGDSVAAQALEAMGVRDAVAEMRVQLDRATGVPLVRIAHSIHRLTPDLSLVPRIVEVLESAGSWSNRMDAAMVLRDFDSPESVAALLRAVREDHDYLVRYHASSSLLALAVIEPADVAEHPEIFKLICSGSERDGEPRDAAEAADHARAAELLAQHFEGRPL